MPALVEANPPLTSFTPEGDYLAVLSPKGTVKIWNTSNESLLAEWNPSEVKSSVGYVCMAISCVGKKRKNEHGMCMIAALGTNEGHVYAIDAVTGVTKWKSAECHPGGVAGLSFVKKGRYICAVGTSGIVYEINSETGEQTNNLKVSKKPISSSVFSLDARFIYVAAGKMRILELENGKELVKFPNDMDYAHCVSVSNDGKTVITSEVGKKDLQIWHCDLSSKVATKGQLLSVPHASSALECKNGSNGNIVVLAVSDSGAAYVWNLSTISETVDASKITVKPRKAIIAARLLSAEAECVKALIACGSLDSPKFNFVEISEPGENIILNAKGAAGAIQENGVSANEGSEVVATLAKDKKANKKRAAPDPDIPSTRGIDAGHDENTDGVLDLVEADPNEPTMGEKLAILQVSESDKSKIHETEASPPSTIPPSADSVNVLLKQALHADDRALLLDCLYNQDEKVIANSVAKLNSSDVVKLLHSIVPLIQSRGAILACALPWIKSLLLQHAGGIMSQESSLLALNSVYQLIESRVSSFQAAIEVSSCLDFLYQGVIDNVEEEDDAAPVIYEDRDESDEEDESEDAMEINEGGDDEEAVDGVCDFEEIEDMIE